MTCGLLEISVAHEGMVAHRVDVLWNLFTYSKKINFLRIGHGYSSDSTLVAQNQFTSWGLVIEKCYKKSIFQGLKLLVSIRGNVEFISPFASSTFELIAFLSSNFKVTVAVAFLQRIILYVLMAMPFHIPSMQISLTRLVTCRWVLRQQVVNHLSSLSCS